MSLGPLGGVNAGVVGSAAGSPLSQTKGSSSERASKDSAAQERTKDTDLKTERSSGIGQTEGDHETSDRDADGRRLWERSKKREQETDETDDEKNNEIDGDGTGGQLDLTA